MESIYSRERSFAERALLRDLENGGFLVDSVWRWVNEESTPAAALPILLEHLDRTSDEKLVDAIARALTQKGFTAAVPGLLNKFPTVSNVHVRWAIANAVAFIGFKGHHEEVLMLVKDGSFGAARQPLVERLHRIKDLPVEPILIQLLQDQTVSAFAASSLSHCGTARSLPVLKELEPTVEHKLSKKYFRKAIEKISGRIGAA